MGIPISVLAQREGLTVFHEQHPINPGGDDHGKLT